jgi:hypothetical protein
MPLFTSADADAIADQARRQHDELGRALGLPPAEPPSAPDEASPLYRDLLLLIEVANGAYHRAEAELRRVELALARVHALLLATPVQAPIVLSEAFWQTKLGVLVARARWWVWADELITISNAAALAFGANNQANRMRIARAIDGGILDWVPDPSIANPQQNRRVLRSQVERLRELRRLPDAD